MRNIRIGEQLLSCKTELETIAEIVSSNAFDSSTRIFNHYCAIKACGTLEKAFKSLISEYFKEHAPLSQITTYINLTIEKSSINPSLDNMKGTLKKFDDNWKIEFDTLLKAHNKYDEIKTSLQSLNDARNVFAHGGSPNITAGDALRYFNDAQIVIQCFEEAIYKEASHT